ncbi:hypothetical protein GGF43_000976 [Coemansia sp. RSA 2618]|nr:hypothetical protein GGF43_000976 [Coemansia sp. RSA 2618]
MLLTANPDDIARIVPASKVLSKEECVELYSTNPALIELREYVQKYSFDVPVLASAPSKPGKQHDAQPLPVVSLCDVANSLLEENRFEDGIRFLASIGSPQLLQDAKVLGNLLRIFKPTHLIEEDLKRRSTYLLGHAKAQSITDYSDLWTVDNGRRRKIVQSQQSVVLYMSSTRTRFMGAWFEETYGEAPSSFWELLQELATLPQSSDDPATTHLELEMYAQRITVACILLEQMNADLAANLADIASSMVIRVLGGLHSCSARIYFPNELLGNVKARFTAISASRCVHEETRLFKLLVDLMATVTTCDAVSRDSCVQVIADFLEGQSCASRVRFLGCISSDMLAISIIDYVLITKYRYSSGLQGPKRQAMLSGPPGMAKTTFCVQYAHQPPSRNSPGEWHDMVCMLTVLVQRTMRVYYSRLCQVNRQAEDLEKAPLPVMLLVNHGTDVSMLRSACGALRSHIASKLPPRDSGLSDESGDGADPNGYSTEERMLDTELDLLELCLADPVANAVEQIRLDSC